MSSVAERRIRYTTLIDIDLDDVDGCWEWMGGFLPDGYGQMGGTTAHRYVYEKLVESVPSDLQVDHLCRNISCVNPDHLEPVTRAENMRRVSAAQTHCKNGHEFNVENTYHRAEGRRGCRPCNAAAAARCKARRTGERAA